VRTALRSRRGLRALAWGAVVVGVATPLVRHRLRLRAPVVSALSWPAPAALALAAHRTPVRDAGIYALQMWAYFAHFDMPDDDPDALLRRLKVDYPIRCDRVIGLGECPTTRLQRALGRDGHVRLLDYGLSAVHWSWFLVPHGTLGYVLLRHRDKFPRSAVLMSACFDLGCVVYWLVPTAPPWWAAQNGSMPPVRRVMAEAGERVWRRLWHPLYHSLQGNPFAAMPSLHFGTSVMSARVLSQVGPGHGALGWAYALALGFGLVYLGEHYVIDLVAGLALAEGIWRLAPRVEPAVRLVALAVQRLEPRVG
jgi:membrane-associated phospholipid phosphatase